MWRSLNSITSCHSVKISLVDLYILNKTFLNLRVSDLILERLTVILAIACFREIAERMSPGQKKA